MNSDHVPVVVKLLVDDVLILGFDLFEPDIAIGAVDGKMSIEEELQPAARMKPEAVLRCRIPPLWAQKNGPKAVLRSALL